MRRGDYDTGISSALSSLQDVLGAPAQQQMPQPQMPQQMPTGMRPQMPQPQMPQPQMPQPQMPQPMRQPQAMTNGPLSAVGRGQMPRSFKEGGRVERDPDVVRYLMDMGNRALPYGLAVRGGLNIDNAIDTRSGMRMPSRAYGSVDRSFDLPGGGELAVRGSADRTLGRGTDYRGKLNVKYDADRLYDLLSR